MILVIAKLTVLLLLAIAIARLFDSRPTLAHCILILAASMVLIFPLSTMVVEQLGWGLLPPQQTRLDRTIVANKESGLEGVKQYEDAWNPGSESKEQVEHRNASLESYSSNESHQDWELIRSVRESSDSNSGKTPDKSVQSKDPGQESGSRKNPEQSISTEVKNDPTIGPKNKHNFESESENVSIATPKSNVPNTAMASIPWRTLLLMAWAVMSLLMFARLLLGCFTAHRIKRSSQPVVNHQMLKQLQTCCQKLSIKQAVSLTKSDEVNCPVVWNWGNACVIVPSNALKKAVHWESVFAHELAHLKRNDHLTGLIGEVASCVFPWHPLVIYLRRRMLRLSEVICDAWAVQTTNAADRYAESLLHFLPTKRNPAFSAMSISKSDFGRRIKRLLSSQGLGPQVGNRTIGVAIIVAVLLTCITVLLRTHDPITQHSSSNNATTKSIVETEARHDPKNNRDLTGSDQDDDQVNQDSRFHGKLATKDWAYLNLVASSDIELTEGQWIELLTSIKNAKEGYYSYLRLARPLVRMKDGKGVDIVASQWENLDPELKVILVRGLTTQGGTSDMLSAVHLGMTSGMKEAIDYAQQALQRRALLQIDDVEHYIQWHDVNKHKQPAEIVAESLFKYLDGADQWDKATQKERFDDVYKAARNRDDLKQLLVDSKYRTEFENHIRTGTLKLASRELCEVLSVLSIDDDVIRPVIKKELDNIVNQWEKMAQTAKTGATCFRPVIHDIEIRVELLSLIKHPMVIPTFIALVEADNHSEYAGIGRGLREFVEPGSHGFHDGAWWRRWWHRNKHRFPADIAVIEIPTLTKSPRAEGFEPFPESLETLKGQLDWLIQQHQEGNDYQEIANKIANSDPQPWMIPTLIGLLDADNSHHAVREIGKCLAAITAVQYSQIHDGPWWRRWWERNKRQYSRYVQSLEIPSFNKTEFARQYTPYLASIDTIEGKLDHLAQLIRAGKEFEFMIDAIGRDHHTPESIPVLIAIMEADASNDTTRVASGYLSSITGQGYEPLYDGKWWRNWWEENKTQFDETVQQIAIPELPKTEQGKSFHSIANELDTIEKAIEYMKQNQLSDDQYRELIDSIVSNGSVADMATIPKLIALLDAGNSQHARNYVNQRLTMPIMEIRFGVKYSRTHDGPWWRRWWNRTRQSLPEQYRDLEVPVLKKTPHGENYEPFPEKLDSVEGTIQWIKEGCPSKQMLSDYDVGQALLVHEDPRTIPLAIGWALAVDPTNSNTIISSGQNDQWENMTGLKPSELRSAQFWQKWWQENKHKFPKEAQDIPIPDLSDAVKRFKESNQLKYYANREVEPKSITATSHVINSDNRKTYVQFGPKPGAEKPDGGWKVLLILAGRRGTESETNHCKYICEHAVPDDYIAIQLIAPVWSDDPNRVIWPTKKLNPQNAKFTTEDFVVEAVNDLKSRLDINENRVFALGWDTGGPAVFANSVFEANPIKGHIIASSLFKPDQWTNPPNAKKQAYYILHAKKNWIDIETHGQHAVATLSKLGAKTKLFTDPSHGWGGQENKNITSALNWLETNAGQN